MSRFALLNDADVKALSEQSKNLNTQRSTIQWLNVYQRWAAERGMDENMNELPPNELDNVLQRFYGEIRKANGAEYEPDCLRVMQGALHRHLVEKKYGFNIISDDLFRAFRNVLEGKARLLRQQGMGKKPNASKALTREDENLLWSIGRLGASSPTSLVRT